MIRPNILLIAAHRLRADMLGCAGHPDARTPNLDAVAAAGLRFANAWTPASGPRQARAALLGAAVDDGRPLAEALRARGYATTFIGDPGAGAPPRHLGFETVATVGDPADPDSHAAWLAAQGRPAPRARVLRHAFGAARSPLPEAAHVTTWIGYQLVRAAQASAEPFFLCAGFSRPGPPYDPPAPWDDLHDPGKVTLPGGVAFAGTDGGPPELTEARLRKVVAYYLASVAHLDQQVGRALATLAARGRGPTIIAFTASCGEALGQGGAVSTDDSPGEACLRVPLLVAGAASQSRGVCDAPFGIGELPRLLWALGTGGGEGALPGHLRGDPPTGPEIVEATLPNGRRALRGRRWKTVAPGGPWWDLARDPAEGQPVAPPPDDPEVAALRAAMEHAG